MSEIDKALATLEERLHAEAGDVVADLERVRAERDAAVGGVPEDLLAEYTPLRARLGGTAVARACVNANAPPQWAPWSGARPAARCGPHLARR